MAWSASPCRRRQYAVRDLHIRGEDLDIAIPSGVAYAAEVRGLITALVVIGDGDVTFSPKPESEKGQLRLVAGDEVLRIEGLATVPAREPVRRRRNASRSTSLKPMETDRGMLDRARKLFGEQVGQSYSLDLNDLSRENWNLVPPIGDLLVDMDLARFGQISYARSGGDSEDISLFDRKRRKNLSVYTSAAQPRDARHAPLQRRGSPRLRRRPLQRRCRRSIPGRLWLEGRADLDLRITSAAAQTLTLRLAEPLVAARGDLRRVRPAARPARARPEQHRRQPARLAAPRPDAAPARVVWRPAAARATGTGGHHGGAADAFGNGRSSPSRRLRRTGTAPLPPVSVEQCDGLCQGLVPGDGAVRFHCLVVASGPSPTATYDARSAGLAGCSRSGRCRADPVALDRGQPVRPGGCRPSLAAAATPSDDAARIPSLLRSGEGVSSTRLVRDVEPAAPTSRARGILDTTTTSCASMATWWTNCRPDPATRVG